MATWSVPLGRWSKATEAKIELVVRKATFDAFGAAVRRSPVDTGRFRANWNVSYNNVNVATSEATSATRADAELRKALSFPVGGVTYLTNSLPYALRLEQGWSRQAPGGMVRLTAIEWSQKLAAAIKSL